MAKTNKQIELEQQISELTQDLQRQRADFENYRKRVETEKDQAKQAGKIQAVYKLLPVIDTIDRAVANVPAELQGNSWAEGVVKLSKNLEKMTGELKLEKIGIVSGETLFDPELHEAIQMDEDTTGDQEVIDTEMQTGWKLEGVVIRPSMVRVTRK